MHISKNIVRKKRNENYKNLFASFTPLKYLFWCLWQENAFTWSIKEEGSQRCLLFTWSIREEGSQRCLVFTWSIRDKGSQRCLLFTWSIRYKGSQRCLLFTWSKREEGRQMCLLFTWSIREEGSQRCLLFTWSIREKGSQRSFKENTKVKHPVIHSLLENRQFPRYSLCLFHRIINKQKTICYIWSIVTSIYILVCQQNYIFVNFQIKLDGEYFYLAFYRN